MAAHYRYVGGNQIDGPEGPFLVQFKEGMDEDRLCATLQKFATILDHFEHSKGELRMSEEQMLARFKHIMED